MLGFRLAVAAALATIAATLSLPAHAQGFGQGGGIASGGFSPPVKGGGVVPNSNILPAPPGLPGAAHRAPAAPSSRSASDLSPNDALFDAINRGDFGTAQDALNRGADVDGHNVLGMTPLELSVDLGRNDITFLLLSMRSSVPQEHAPAAPGARTATAGLGKPHASALASAAAPRRLSATMRASRTAPTEGDGLAPASVRYAGANPGTPVPAAGFLGFGP